MCVPVVIGIATAVVGAVGSIAQYQQQQAQVTAANNAAWQQTVLQNQQIRNQADTALRQNIFQLQMHNQGVEFQNQQTLQSSIMAMDQTVRGNLRMHQEWQNAVVQNNFANLSNELDYTQQLNQSILSKSVADIQQQMNQRGLNVDLEDAQRRMRDAQALSALEGEKLMVSNLQMSGSVLATGKSGQSIGLALQSVDAAYGRDREMLSTNFQNKVEDFYSDVTKAHLKKVQSDWDAISKIIPEPPKPIGIAAPPEPVYAGMPSAPVFAPMQTKLAPMGKTIFAPAPVKTPGPGGLGLVAGIGNSIMGGISAGMQAKAMIPKPGQK
jgi:hypothetical protein